MLSIGTILDNRTICDLFGVASMGGIRVCKARNHIVLISNNTDPLYRNEWKDGVLHFVGMGSIGPQKLDRQNRTLANATKHGATLHLFEVFEKSHYVYAGELALVGEPYISDQADARAESRFVWIFPLRSKAMQVGVGAVPSDDVSAELDHLPHGAYAVIGSNFRDDQTELVNRLVDELREAGVSVFDQRDVERSRYDKTLTRWHAEVMNRARSSVRGLIAKKNKSAKGGPGSSGVIDDELRISSASTEQELRTVMKLLDLDDRSVIEELFERARQSVPMPEVPRSLISEITDDPIEDISGPRKSPLPLDRKTFDQFT